VSAFSPKFQASVHAAYDWDIDVYHAFVTGDVSYTGEMWTQPANYTPSTDPNESPIPDTTDLRCHLPAYTTLAATLGARRDNWTVRLVGTNLTNSNASTFTNTAQFITAEVPLRPRTISINFTASY
jgi:hypothetical protein